MAGKRGGNCQNGMRWHHTGDSCPDNRMRRKRQVPVPTGIYAEATANIEIIWVVSVARFGVSGLGVNGSLTDPD